MRSDASGGSCGGPDAAKPTAPAAPRPTPAPDTDETLQHPRCVFQVLKRHFARYTPEMVEQVCGVPRDLFAQVCELITANSGRDRTTAFVYSARLDSAHRRRAVHPHRGDPAGAAGQHGPARRRDPGPARPRLHPGLHRHPHAVRPAARLPARCRTRTATRTSTPTSQAESVPNGLLGEHPRVPGQPAEGLVGRRRDGRERLLLRLPAAADRQPQHLRDGPGAARRHLQGLLPVRPEPGRRLGQRQDAAAGHGQAGLAGGPGPRADRERHLVEGRPGDRDRRAAHRGHRHRGVLPARRRAHREVRQLHQHPAAAAVAPSGRRAGRRRPQRPVVHLPPRAPDPGEAGRLHRRGGPAGAGPHLGLPDRRARRTSRTPTRCWPRSTAGTPTARRCRRTPQLTDDGSTACGCWIYCGVYADGVNQAARRTPWRQQNLGGPGLGLGVAGEPAHPLQPGLGRPRRQAVERAQGAGLVGRGTAAVDRARRAGLRRRPSPVLPAARRARPAWTRSPAPIRSSCRPTARRGCSLRRG